MLPPPRARQLMCGLAGVLDLDRRTAAPELEAVTTAMAARLRHRGPDAAGSWADPEAGIAFAHRRLSIVDVSDAGAQPMHSSSGRYVLSYNGEIYNAPALAVELAAHGRRFTGHCDTEVLLEAIDEWGLERALERANGMFAFSLWDRQHRRLHLVRDRVGEKPLYYGWMGTTLLFGSELPALRAHPAFRGEIDRDALALYLRFNCVPAPWSIFRGVSKLPPASILTVDPADRPHDSVPVAYWSALAGTDPGESAGISDDDAVEHLDDLLHDATRLRMRSDVPLGAFLSGGIDSSTVVALMQAQSADAARTFTIGNAVSAFNEADVAHEVSQLLGTRHHELLVTPDDALSVIPRLASIYGEPFADSSQIPTLLVSEVARRDVTVSLSGDGGDELFGGYDRYRMVPRVSSSLGRLPGPLRRSVAGAMSIASPGVGLARLLPTRVRPRLPASKLAKLATITRLDTPEAMYRQLVSHWDDPEDVVIGSDEPPTASSLPWPDVGGPRNAMMAIDTVTYLPDDILVKLDRATMSVGLEARVPLLDHRVVEFAARLPERLKFRNGQSKWILRQVLHRHLPERLFARPKSGFGVPIGEWLRGPLRGWADDLLSPDRLRREGYLRPEPITRLWEQHLSGRRSHEYRLWDVLMFESWLESLDT